MRWGLEKASLSEIVEKTKGAAWEENPSGKGARAVQQLEGL